MIHEIDSAGKSLGLVTRKGPGPGEFTYIWSMGFVGDTLWVADESNMRVTMLDRARNVVGMFRFAAPEFSGWRAPQLPATLISDGTAIASYRRRVDPSRVEAERMLVRLNRPTSPALPGPLRVGARGNSERPTGEASGAVLSLRDTVATLSLENYQVHTPVNTPGRTTPLSVYFTQPLGDNMLWATAHDGMSMVFVERRAASVADSASFGVTKLIYGDTAIARRYPYTPVTVTAAVIDSILANTEEGKLGMSRDAVYQPRFRPPVTEALLGLDGSVWLRREFSYAPIARWTIIAPSGETVGDIGIPASHTVHAADERHVWTTITDEDDVPLVIRHRIVKSPGRS